MPWTFARIGLLGVSLLLSVAVGSMARGETPDDARPVISTRQIEADWLRQEQVRWLPKTPRSRPAAAVAAMTTRQDAAGGNDGVKDGTYGFHTSQDAKPWWQVDLGSAVPLDRVVIYNRCDGKVEDRAARLIVLLSGDGKTWTVYYRHDGSSFLGRTDDKPLVVSAAGETARFVRVQLPGPQYFHLDEVEVYRTGSEKNVAIGRPADQSSASQWSRNNLPPTATADASSPEMPDAAYRVEEVIEHGLALGADLTVRGVNVEDYVRDFKHISVRLLTNPLTETRRKLYLEARWIVRRMALANPLLDFDDLLFVKRVPGTFTHMSDQYYGWWSRPGGGLCVLEDFKSDSPRLRCLTEDFEPGSVLRPDLSHDGTRVLFAYCKY
ncbi:MAG: discoidin domain-containing protein, partial [Planctomycetes bacterium]|nr:discoidin domain-containing protein [Planctomycetota bacterium]